LTKTILNIVTITTDNHYVSRGYLKRWVSSDKRLYTYRLLVSHPEVPLWKKSSPRGVAKLSHLYTRIVAGHETDDIERWLNQDFESPAEEALHKVTENRRLTPEDWKRLVRFLAAQDVRTPARLIEDLQRWDKTLPHLIENTLQEVVHELELAQKSGDPLPQLPPHPYADYLPFRVKTEILPDQEFGTLTGEVLLGRSLWLFGLQQALTQTVKILLQHRWTILRVPAGAAWITSDNPVIRLNYYGDDKYDFKGGWGRIGSELLLPLNPHHLLYTQIGKQVPPWGTPVSRSKAEKIQQFIAEHAHRMIFASNAYVEVPRLRPRTVDAALFQHENEQWKKWHEEQIAAEQE
jgi:Protein of unknown function (DUF4238)